MLDQPLIKVLLLVAIVGITVMLTRSTAGARHQAVRDDLVRIFRSVPGLAIRAPEAGSYLFPRLPPLSLPLHQFVRALRVQAAVTVTPGTEFSPDATDSIRLNFSQNHEAAVNAAERIAQMIERYRTA